VARPTSRSSEREPAVSLNGQIERHRRLARVADLCASPHSHRPKVAARSQPTFVLYRSAKICFDQRILSKRIGKMKIVPALLALFAWLDYLAERG